MSPTASTALVLSQAKALQLVGETALEVALNHRLGGSFTARDADGMLLAYAMFRTAADPDSDPDSHERLGNTGETPAKGADLIDSDRIMGVYVTWALFTPMAAPGFTESHATLFRSIYWQARDEVESLIARNEKLPYRPVVDEDPPYRGEPSTSICRE